jgi:hypothetical protein
MKGSSDRGVRESSKGPQERICRAQSGDKGSDAASSIPSADQLQSIDEMILAIRDFDNEPRKKTTAAASVDMTPMIANTLSMISMAITRPPEIIGTSLSRVAAILKFCNAGVDKGVEVASHFDRTPCKNKHAFADRPHGVFPHRTHDSPERCSSLDVASDVEACRSGDILWPVG